MQAVEVAEQVLEGGAHRVDHLELLHFAQPGHKVLAERLERHAELEAEHRGRRADYGDRRAVVVLHRRVEDGVLVGDARARERLVPRRIAKLLEHEAAQRDVHQAVHLAPGGA